MGKEKLTLIAILVLGLALRLWGANQSFWLDEASQAQLSSLSLAQVWSGRGGDFHPPLFYLLAHEWLKFGQSEVWLRLLPIGIGLVGVGLMSPLARAVLGQKEIKIGNWKLDIGFCASFLLAINPFHIYYSQEFRMYSLLAALGIWTMYLWLKNSRWLFLSLALMLYTHYASVLLLATLFIYPFVFDRTKLKYFTIHLALSLLLYIPWWPQFVYQLHSGVNIDNYLPGWRSILAVGPGRAVPLVIFKLTAGRIDFVSPIVYAIYLSYVLALVGVSVLLATVKRSFLITWLLGPIVLAVLISFVVPLTQPFRLIFVIPALILILCQSVSRFPRTVLLLTLYISITGVVMYATRPRLQREQWRQASQFLVSQSLPTSQVVVKFTDRFAPLQWYAPDLKVVGAVPSYPAKNNEVTSQLANGLREKDNVYVLDYLGELTDPYQVVDKSIADMGFEEQETINFEGVGFIRHYDLATSPR